MGTRSLHSPFSSTLVFLCLQAGVTRSPRTDSDTDQVRVVAVHLRSLNSWYELDGLLAVHYIGADALDGYDCVTRAFVDRTHVMFLPGLGWVFCRVARLPPNRGLTGVVEAFGVRVFIPTPTTRPVPNTARPSARARSWRRSDVGPPSPLQLSPRPPVTSRATGGGRYSLGGAAKTLVSSKW
jgi:hypothetical protein